MASTSQKGNVMIESLIFLSGFALIFYFWIEVKGDKHFRHSMGYNVGQDKFLIKTNLNELKSTQIPSLKTYEVKK